MSKTVDPSRTYVGVVENNNDPKKIGRCQIKVLDVFDNFKVEDLPWASPWKDLNGNQFNVPDKGKVVTVVFENGNLNNPEYISSDHYNQNLENKLQQLDGEDYLSMKALIFDHKTQIYVNDTEGVKIDHKFNNINIKEKTIDVSLKDNFGKISLGSPNATQRAILGDNFTNWLDTFLQILMGAQGGPFLGNLAAPVIATPALLSHIQLYFQQKDPKLLSKNVYIVDNDSVKKQERTEGVSEAQKGDKWKSTVEENKLTTEETVKFTPMDGSSSSTFQKPPIDAEKPPIAVDLAPQVPDVHPDVDVLLELIRMKNYKLYQKPFELNIVAIRNQCLATGDRYTDEFVDKVYVLYKDDRDVWQVKNYVFSTMPGVEFTMSEDWINKQTDLPLLYQVYWSNKIGERVTFKDVLRGPVINGVPITSVNTNIATNVILGNLNDSGKKFVNNLPSEKQSEVEKSIKDLLVQEAISKGLSVNTSNIDNISKNILNSIKTRTGTLENLASDSIVNSLSSFTNKLNQTTSNLLQGQGGNIISNIQGQAGNLVSGLQGQGQGLVSSLQNQATNLASGQVNSFKNSLSSNISQNQLQNLVSKGIDVDKVEIDINKAKSLGISIDKVTDMTKLTSEDISKLASNNISITKLRSSIDQMSKTGLDIKKFI
jgi:hypothetical protein